MTVEASAIIVSASITAVSVLVVGLGISLGHRRLRRIHPSNVPVSVQCKVIGETRSAISKARDETTASSGAKLTESIDVTPVTTNVHSKKDEEIHYLPNDEESARKTIQINKMIVIGADDEDVSTIGYSLGDFQSVNESSIIDTSKSYVKMMQILAKVREEEAESRSEAISQYPSLSDLLVDTSSSKSSFEKIIADWMDVDEDEEVARKLNGYTVK
jgi:hypothetical protein